MIKYCFNCGAAAVPEVSHNAIYPQSCDFETDKIIMHQ